MDGDVFALTLTKFSKQFVIATQNDYALGRAMKNPTHALNKKRNFCLPTKVRFFELSVPLARNVKYASQVKCAFGTICGTLNFSLRQERNTSLGRKV